MENGGPSLDQQIAAEVLAQTWAPSWMRFTTDNDAAEWLVEWLREKGIGVIGDGNSVTFWKGRERLFAQHGRTTREALARGVLHLAREYPQAIGWRKDDGV